MESVLVTGAGGYIGSNAAEYFANAGYSVIGTVRSRVAERLTRLGIKTIKVDLADAANLPRERFCCVRPCVVYGRGDTSITPRTVARRWAGIGGRSQ